MNSKALASTWQGLAADLSLTRYAGDLQKMVIADPGSTLRAFLDKLRRVDDAPDESLAPCGYGLNLGLKGSRAKGSRAQ
eukprot:2080541-Pyramimonas_sp.AAC.1